MRFPFRNFSDTEVLEQIRNGNKSVLIRLFRYHFRRVRNQIRNMGGTPADARNLLREAIAQLWDSASGKDFKLENGTIRTYLDQKVKALWLVQHGETEIRNYIKNKIDRPSGFNKKLAIIGSLALLVFLAAWWYYDSAPINSFREKTSLFVPAKDSAAMTLKSLPVKIKSKKDHKNSASGEPESELNDSLEVSETDTSTAGIENLSETDSGSRNIQYVSDEIVIKKDELLFSRIIQVIEKNPSGKETKNEKSLAQETAEKLNPEAGLPEEEEKTTKSFTVEFWKSPVNYKGYKMGKNKLVFYGIEEPDLMKLFSLESAIYMEYGLNYYRLEPSYDFRNFIPVSDVSITSVLKK